MALKWRYFSYVVIILTVVFCIFSESASAGWNEFIFDPNDSYLFENIGGCVKISADYAFIYAWDDDPSGIQVGGVVCVYSYLQDNTWDFEQVLYPDTGNKFSKFGKSIDVEGDTLIIGSYGDNTYNVYSGACYVYRNEGGVWVRQQKLFAPDPEEQDRFGYVLDVDGEVLVVGAYYANGQGQVYGSGAAYVFRYNSSNWVFEQKLVQYDPTGDWFGSSVGISGDFIVVGAPTKDSGGEEQAGAAYVYRYNGSNWQFYQKIEPFDPDPYADFGSDLQIKDNELFISAEESDLYQNGSKISMAGCVYHYVFSDPNWQFVQKIVDNEPNDCENFGCSLGFDGNRLVIGSHHDYYEGDYFGAAFSYIKQENSWVLENKFRPFDMSVYTDRPWYGNSVDVYQDKIAVGAIYNEPADRGKAFTYEKTYPIADLSGDWLVNFSDFAILASQWQEVPGVPSADIAPCGGDGVVDINDLSVLCDDWLAGVE